MIVASTTRYIGNYGELELTISRKDDGDFIVKAEVSCPYGSEWPFEIGGRYDISILGPIMREMYQELGAPSLEPDDHGR